MFDVLVTLVSRVYSSRSAIAVGQSVPDQVDRIELNHYWWTAGCESHQSFSGAGRMISNVTWRSDSFSCPVMVTRILFASDASGVCVQEQTQPSRRARLRDR